MKYNTKIKLWNFNYKFKIFKIKTIKNNNKIK